MLVVADTHVHIYPFHDLAEIIRVACANLEPLAGGSEHVKMLCLAERHDCHAFRDLAEGRSEVPGGMRVEPAGDDALVVEVSDGSMLYLLAGRQLVTGERLELLALTSDLSIPDGRPAADLAEAIRAEGAVPVLSWAPGKWLFRRGDAVRALVEEASPGSLVIGDTAARASSSEPRLMRLAQEKGIAVIAGTDPLPLAGEEQYVGTYASVLETEFDGSAPAASMRNALTSTDTSVRRVGRRNGHLESLRRSVSCALRWR